MQSFVGIVACGMSVTAVLISCDRDCREYVMILLKGGVPMSFGGSEEPAAYGELVSIGGLGQGVNGKLSAAIADILESKLSVDKSRFYIKFYDVEGSYFGFRGSTF